MLKRAVEMVQTHLKTHAGYTGAIDGTITASVGAAALRFLQQHPGEAASDPAGWPDKRRAVAVLQLMAKQKNIQSGPIDGFWGPVTDNAHQSLEHLQKTGRLPDNWRDEEPAGANPNLWPRDTGSQSEMRAFYGTPGQPPIKKVRCPWTLRLAWNLADKTTTVGCHAKVADSLEKVFDKVFRHYGEAELKRLRLDLFGGCFANRKKRGGSTWSTHAWAVALDFDPDRNKLQWGRDRASLDDPAYNFWWQTWEAEGWVSLGRSRNFDWMHVQAARL
jgi:hypothetical protein